MADFTLGQKTAQKSIPVVLNSDASPVTVVGEVEVKNDTGSSIPVSVGSLPLPAGAATAGNQATEITNLVEINDGIPASLGQAVMAASMPVVLPSDQSSLLFRLADSVQLDAFGRLRVSEPTSLFEAQFQYDSQPLLFSSSVGGGGAVAHNSNHASVDLSVGTTSGASAIFQTKLYFKYHAGKSQSIVFTGNFVAAKSGCRRRYGQFDETNGCFFEYETSPSVVVRTSTSGGVVDGGVPQSAWNLDKLDGTGASGVSLNLSLQQIFSIDYQWLGTGRIRFGFTIGGKLIYCHEVNNANVLTLPYSQTATLPLRFEIVNTATTSSATTSHVTCATIYSEGGFSPEGVARTTSTGLTLKAIASSGKIPVLSIRKSTAGLKVPVQLIGTSMFCGSLDDLLITFNINAVLTGAVFTAVDSFVEQDRTATAMSGGTEIYSFYLKGTNTGGVAQLAESFFDLANVSLGNSLSAVSDIMTVAAESLTGSANAAAVINFKELY